MNYLGGMPARPKPPRARNATETSSSILTAARRRFASDGYERTTIRAVARDADVDPALVIHYFGSKESLFAAAAQLELSVPDLSQVPVERLADAILPAFFQSWRPHGPFLGMLRAAASNAEASQLLVRVFADQVAPSFTAIALDKPAKRAALVGTQLIGVAVCRFIIRLPAIEQMSERELILWLRPVIAHYLTGRLPR